MAFNINAQVILSGPKNLKSVTKNIQKQLSGLTATVNVKIPQGTGRRIGALNKHLTTLNSNLATLKRTSAGVTPTLNTLSNSLGSVAKNSSKLGRSYKTLNKSLSGITKQTTQASSALQSFGKEAANAIRRFAAFSVATGTIYGFIRSVQDATKNALQFQRELVKLQQITGQGGKALDGVRKTVDNLSRSLGIDANELLKIGRIFAQTGQTLNQVEKSLKAVARSSLAPTFGTMESTAEGLVAALAQFNIQARDSEKVLGSLNAVSKKFAVESGDLISAIRRAGGVFAATANQMTAPIDSLNELISIFTAVRSTTRESADSIATGLRTIFTRIQRPRTIEFLKQFGIQLVDLRGNFKGIFPAFKELSRGLQGIIAQGDTLTLARITEELGGIRQVGKLIPAIRNFDKALRALDVASKGAAEGLGKDVALALQPLAKQFEQLQARFESFVRTIASSTTFQNLAKVAISTANAFLTMAEALQPLLPLLTSLAAVKLSSGLIEFGKGFAGGFKRGGGAGGLGKTVGGIAGGGGGGAATRSITSQNTIMKALSTAIKANNQRLGQNTQGLGKVATSLGTLSSSMAKLSAQIRQMPGLISSSGFGFGRRPRGKAAGGKIQKFASGGYVKGPSHGAGGVLAELEGGEYVVPKGYARGGRILDETQIGAAILEPHTVPKETDPIKINRSLIKASSGNKITPAALDAAGFPAKSKSYDLVRSPLSKSTYEEFNKALEQGIVSGINTAGQMLSQDLGVGFEKVPGTDSKAFFNSINRAIKGNLFENILNAVETGSKFTGLGDSNRPFDFEKGLQSSALGVKILDDFRNLASVSYIDAKASFTAASPREMKKKALNTLKRQILPRAKGPGDFNFDDLDENRKQELKTLLAKKTIQDTERKKIAGILGTTKSKLTGNLGINNLRERVKNLAAGGNVFAPRGTDTVPAMLTPGEFVINKRSAEKIGYSNLGKMNRYAKGGAVGHAQYLQRGGVAEGGGVGALAALVGLGTTFASLDFSSENASDSLVNLALTSSFLLPQLSGLGDAFKGLKTQGKSLTNIFTKSGRASAQVASGQKLVADLNKKIAAGRGATAGSRAAKKAASAQKLLPQARATARSAQFAKLGKGGIATLIATLVADPVIDFIGSKTFGQQGGRAERDVQRAEAEGRVLGGAKGLISGAATGAFIGSFAGPVGTLVGGIIGGVGGLIEGALRGAKLEGLRQSEFDSIQKLQKANEAVTQTFEALSKSGHALTTAQLAQGTEVLRQRRQDAAGVERATLRRTEEEDKGFGGLNIAAGFSAAANALTGGFAGRSLQQQAEDRQSASVQAAVSTVTQADVAAATEVATRATEKLVNGIGNLSPQMLKAIANTGDMTEALAKSDPTVRGFARQLDKMQKEALAASVMAEVATQLQILNDAGDRKGAVKLGEQYKSLTPLLNNNAVSVASLEVAASQLDGPIKSIVARQAEQRKESTKSAAITKQLAIAQADAARRLDAFTTSMDLFGRSVSQVMDKMNDSIKTAEASIDALSQVSTNIGAVSGTSVFKNLETASNIDIQGAIDDIASVSPEVGGEALRDVADIIKAQRDLPGILREVVGNVAEEAARNTFDTKGGLPEQQSAAFATAIEQGLKARGINLPDSVLKNIQTGLAEDFNRQEGGSGGGDIADILINQGLNKIQGVVGNFGTAARKAMEEAEAGVKAWRNGLIKSANLQLKLTRQQISSQLKINQKQFAIQDKINNVLGKPDQFQARGRLQTQLGAILGSPAQQRAAGAGVVDVGGPGGLRAEQLVNQRKILEQQRRTLEADKQSARLDQDLAKKLKLNADALERNKRATELLANDVSVLSDLERRAANAAQAERDATSGLVGLSRAVDELQASRTPWGTFSRDAIERFNEITRPITALFRATNAGNLDTRQARALITAIESGDARIAALLDRLPGGREQADMLRRNIALSLGETVRSQLGDMGGPSAAGFMQVPSIYQDVIRGSLDERNNIAEQMRQVGENQNALLSRTMETITDGTLREMSRVNATLNRTLGQLEQLIRDLFVNRGGEDKKETIQEFGKGGFVKGPSHAAGGVMAKLEGGEYVIPKKYANGGYVDKDKQEAIRKWRMSRKAARAEKEKNQWAHLGYDKVVGPGLEGSIADDIDAEIRSPANAKTGGTWSGGLTKEQAAQQQKDFKAKLTKEKTLFGSTAASRGLDTLGSAFSTLSHGVIGAGQGVIGGAAHLVGASGYGGEYLRESGARLRAAGQHAQNVGTLGGRFKYEVSQDAFEQFRGDRVEDEGQKWAYGVSQFMAEMAPVGAVAKGVGVAAKGASYVGKLGKGARAAVKAKAGAKAKGLTSTMNVAPEFKAARAAMQAPTKAKGAAKSVATKLSDDEIKAIRSAEAAEVARRTNASRAAARTGGDDAAMLPPGLGGASMSKKASKAVPKTVTTVKRPPLPKQKAAAAREVQAAKTGVKKKGKGSAGRDARRAQKPGTLANLILDVGASKSSTGAIARRTVTTAPELTQAAIKTPAKQITSTMKVAPDLKKAHAAMKAPTKAKGLKGALTHVPGESKSVAETLYGAGHWTSAKASFGMGSLSKLLDPALMLATRGLQYLQKGKGEAGVDLSKAGGAVKDIVKPLERETDLPISKASTSVTPLEMETDLPPTSKPDAKTGPKTPSLRHQRAFMRRQARKRRLGIATDFDTARGSGSFRPGVQSSLKESGLWDWARLGGQGAGGAGAVRGAAGGIKAAAGAAPKKDMFRLDVPPTRRQPFLEGFGPNTPINRAPAADTPVEQFSTEPRGHMGDPFDYDSQWKMETQRRHFNYQQGFGPAPWTMGGKEQFLQQRYGRRPVQMRFDEYAAMRQPYAGGGRRTALRPAVGGGAPGAAVPAKAKAKAKRKTGGRRQATMDRNRFRALEKQVYQGQSLSVQDQAFYDSYQKTKDTKRAAYRKGSGGYGARQKSLRDTQLSNLQEAQDRVAAMPGKDPNASWLANMQADVKKKFAAAQIGKRRAKIGKRTKSEDEKAFWAAIGEGRRGVRAEEKDRRVARFRRARGYAGGGSVFTPRGTDTVPAMLTPGEFVINKSSAQSIGYNRLNSMNRMAQGGVVQPQYLQNGGYATNGGDVAAQLADSQASMNRLADALGKIPQSIDLNLQGDSRVIIDFGADMVPQVKKYFQEWYQEALKGPQGRRLDGSSPDPSMTNQ